MGAEGLRLLEAEQESWITMGQIIDFFNATNMERINSQIVEGAFPKMAQDIIEPFAHLSALLVFMISAILLLFMSRSNLR